MGFQRRRSGTGNICSVPIISAVGHETDVTIADYVADARAETPTAAAQMATSDVSELLRILGEYDRILNRMMADRLNGNRIKLAGYERVVSAHSPIGMINEKRFATSVYEDKLVNAMRNILESRRNRLALLAGDLNGVSPLEKFSQGYSFTEDANGNCVSNAANVHEGDKIVVHVRNGYLDATVDNVTVIDRK